MPEKHFTSKDNHAYHSRNDLIGWLKDLTERIEELEAKLEENKSKA